MAVVYRFPDRIPAGRQSTGDGDRLSPGAEILILPCIRHERMELRRGADTAVMPAQLQA